MNTSFLSTIARLLLTVPVMVASLNSYAAEVGESTENEEKPASEAAVPVSSLQLAEENTENKEDDEEPEAFFNEVNPGIG